MKTHNSIRLKY